MKLAASRTFESGISGISGMIGGYRGGDGHKSYSPPFLYCNFHLRYLSFRIKIYISAALYTVWPHRPEISDNPDTPETKVVNKKVSLIKRETFTIFFIHSLFL